MKQEKMYRCIGQNFVDDRLMGGDCCGDVGTLDYWVARLYGDKGQEYFSTYDSAEIREYLYSMAGLRLKKYNANSGGSENEERE